MCKSIAKPPIFRYTLDVNRELKGFREIEHTADWELEVWAPDLPALLEQAARGMYSLMSTQMAAGPRRSRRLVLDAPDREGLLVTFLEELRYLGEVEGVAFDSFDLQSDGLKLKAHLEGRPIASQSKEIKAVTYHNLAVRQTDRGLEANVVFDV